MVCPLSPSVIEYGQKVMSILFFSLLDKDSEKLLKVLNSQASLPIDELSESDMKAGEFLVENKLAEWETVDEAYDSDFIVGTYTENAGISITKSGKSYLREKKNKKLQIWLPITISALALLVSICSFIVSLLK